jgi:hypothetical protein
VRPLLTLTALTALVLLVSIPATAVPPQPSQGMAVVDGVYAEWNLTNDFFADMYRAGKPDKPLESKLYLCYDCTTSTMYAFVLCEPDVVGYIDSLVTTAWIAIGSRNNKVVNELAGNDGVPPDFAWVGQGFDGDPLHVKGCEASFQILPGSYIIIAHIIIWDVTGQASATMGFSGTGPDLVVPNCQTAVEPTTFGAIKALYR